MGTGTQVPCTEDWEKWVEKFKIPRENWHQEGRPKASTNERWISDEMQIMVHFQNDLNTSKILKK